MLGNDNYFEDFVVGDRFWHSRGKTVTDFETMTLAQLVMNTSDGHYDIEKMRGSEFGAPLTFGGVVAAMVYGIASQDTAEQALQELGFDSIRFPAPTVSGDTLHVLSEVLKADERDAVSGEVSFAHVGVNQHGNTVCEIQRRVILRKRSNGM